MIVINSKDRSSGTSGNFTVRNLNKNKAAGFMIEYVHLPYSWYNITSNTNAIVINGGTSVTVTPGSYSASSLASALQTSLQLVDATFTVTFSTTTLKFTIARSTNFVLNLSNSGFTMKRQLGFRSTSNTGSSTSHTSDSVVNLQNGNSVYLHSNVLSMAQDNKISDSRNEFVLSIPIDKNPGELIVYKPYRSTYLFKDAFDINAMTLYLKDADQNNIDLNGVDWEIKILFL